MASIDFGPGVSATPQSDSTAGHHRQASPGPGVSHGRTGTVDLVPLSPEHDRQAISLIRGFAMDAPLAAKSGHQGTAMALAPLAHVLYSRVMRHDPADPAWPDRDRFVLSNGHASILQYSLLYLSGYGLELDDIKAVPPVGVGHARATPRRGHTAGVEVTTGPLGQGFANAVGMAIAERHLRAQFGDELIDHHTFVIAGDGCFMEGVSHEAASLAGHLGLGGLVCVYDDNHITIDGDTALAYSDDVAGRFEAYGWHVEHLGEIADDLDALEAALRRAMAVTDRPSLLVLRSHIGVPQPRPHRRPRGPRQPVHRRAGHPHQGRHGHPRRAVLGAAPSWSTPTARTPPTAARPSTAPGRPARTPSPHDARRRGTPAGAPPACPAGPTRCPRSSRARRSPPASPSRRRSTPRSTCVPGLVAGAADLTGNTGTKLAGQSAQSIADTPTGARCTTASASTRMGSAMVGMALHGGVLPAGGTFFVFLDYMRPPVRLAALSRAKVVFVFTHDSVGVGEDGPTHQPVEHLATLRAIPGLQVIRPADANETVAAWRACRRARRAHGAGAVAARTSPCAPTARPSNAAPAWCVDGRPTRRSVLVATGSEVAVCVDAAERLGHGGHRARRWSACRRGIASRAKTADYRAVVLPAGVPVLSVEAATTFGWERCADDSIGIDRFGASAPGAVVLDQLGINVDHVVDPCARCSRHRPDRRGDPMDRLAQPVPRVRARARGSTT